MVSDKSLSKDVRDAWVNKIKGDVDIIVGAMANGEHCREAIVEWLMRSLKHVPVGERDVRQTTLFRMACVMKEGVTFEEIALRLGKFFKSPWWIKQMLVSWPWKNKPFVKMGKMTTKRKIEDGLS